MIVISTLVNLFGRYLKFKTNRIRKHCYFHFLVELNVLKTFIFRAGSYTSSSLLQLSRKCLITTAESWSLCSTRQVSHTPSLLFSGRRPTKSSEKPFATFSHVSSADSAQSRLRLSFHLSPNWFAITSTKKRLRLALTTLIFHTAYGLVIVIWPTDLSITSVRIWLCQFVKQKQKCWLTRCSRQVKSQTSTFII